ncbi:MAG: hypothetical protein JO039_09645 [Solirubrobacterales bacterium]|nr:hypothetical protein [Solirubrobacterales bacterium]
MLHHRHRKIALPIALAIAAIPPSTAAARPYLDPGSNLQHQATTPAAIAQPHPDRHTAPAELGLPPVLRPARASEQQAITRAETQEVNALADTPPQGARYSNAEQNAYAPATAPVATTPPAAGGSSNAFDYGDAAIGAGITAAIALLITGRQPRSTPAARAPPSLDLDNLNHRPPGRREKPLTERLQPAIAALGGPSRPEPRFVTCTPPTSSTGRLTRRHLANSNR